MKYDPIKNIAGPNETQYRGFLIVERPATKQKPYHGRFSTYWEVYTRNMYLHPTSGRLSQLHKVSGEIRPNLEAAKRFCDNLINKAKEPISKYDKWVKTNLLMHHQEEDNL